MEPASIFRKKESKEVLRQREQEAKEERQRQEEAERVADAELEKKRKAEEFETKFQLQLQQAKRDAEAMFKNGGSGSGSGSGSDAVVDLSEGSGSASKRRKSRHSVADEQSDDCVVVVEKSKSTGSSSCAPINTGFFAPKRSVSCVPLTTNSSSEASAASSSSSSFSVLDANCAIPFPLVAPVPAVFSFVNDNALFNIRVSSSPPSPGLLSGSAAGSGYWLSNCIGVNSAECEWRKPFILPPGDVTMKLFACPDDSNSNFQPVRSPTDVAVDWIRGDLCSYKSSVSWSLFWRSLVSHYYGLSSVDGSSAVVHTISDSEPGAMDAVVKAIDKLRHPSRVDQFAASVAAKSAFVNPRKLDSEGSAGTANPQFATILSWLTGRAAKARLPGSAAAQSTSDSKKRSTSSSTSRRTIARSSSSSRRKDQWYDSGSDEDEEGLEATADSNNILVIQGPHSSGKSSIVYACAEQLKYNVIEINASQCRSHDEIKRICREAMQSRGLNFTDSSSMLSNALAFGSKATSKPKANIIDSKKSKRGRGRTKQVLQDEEEEEDEEEVRIVEPSAAARKDLNLILFEDVDILFEGEDFGFHNAILTLMKDAKCPVILTCTKWGGHGVSGHNDPARYALDRLIKGLHKDNVPLIVHLQPVAAPSQCNYSGFLASELTKVIDAPTLAEISNRLPLPALVDMLVTYCHGDIRGMLQSLTVLLLGTDTSSASGDRGDLLDSFERSLRYHWHLDFSYMDHLKDVLCGALMEPAGCCVENTSVSACSASTPRLQLAFPTVRDVEPRICKAEGGHVVTILGGGFVQPQYCTTTEDVTFAAVAVFLRCVSAGIYTDTDIPTDQVRVLSDSKIQFMLPQLDEFGMYSVVVEVSDSVTGALYRCDGSSCRHQFASTSSDSAWTVAETHRENNTEFCFDGSAGREAVCSDSGWILVVDYLFASEHQYVVGDTDAQIAKCMGSVAACKKEGANSTYRAVRQYRRQLQQELRASIAATGPGSAPNSGRKGKPRGIKSRRVDIVPSDEVVTDAAAAASSEAAADVEAAAADSEEVEEEGGDKSTGEEDTVDDDFEDGPVIPADTSEVGGGDESMAVEEEDHWITSLPESLLNSAVASDRFVITPASDSLEGRVCSTVDEAVALEQMSRMLDAWSDSDVLGSHMGELYRGGLVEEHPETTSTSDDVASSSAPSRSASSASLCSDDLRLSRSESGDLADLFSSRAPSIVPYAQVNRSSFTYCCVSKHCCTSPTSYGSSLRCGATEASTVTECERELTMSADLTCAMRDLAVHCFNVTARGVVGLLGLMRDITTPSPENVDLTDDDDDALFDGVTSSKDTFGSGNSFLELYAKYNGHKSIGNYMDFIRIRHEFTRFLWHHVLYPGVTTGQVDLGSKFMRPLHGNRSDLSHSFYCATFPYLCLIMKAEEITFHHYADYCARRASASASAGGGDDQEEEFDCDMYACSAGVGMSFIPSTSAGSGRPSRGRSTRSSLRAQEPQRFPYTTSYILPSVSSTQLEQLLYTYGLSFY